jgi:hypothetical protein
MINPIPTSAATSAKASHPASANGERPRRSSGSVASSTWSVCPEAVVGRSRSGEIPLIADHLPTEVDE